jgi:hypothetical protein
MKNSFRGQEVPVTKDLGEFVRLVLDGTRPYGLNIQMASFVEVYGELQHSAGGQGRPNPFHISPSSGPCWVICAKCEVELDESTIAALGKNSVMAAFGVPPVLECRKCGNVSAVIVAA